MTLLDTIKPTILAIIPARSGSKGIPNKNIKPLLGKPLIAYTVEAALKSDLVSRVIVSTDSREISRISKSYGAEVPFMRPKELAEDNSSTEDVVINVLENIKKENFIPDIIVLLQPTSPLRNSLDVDNAIDLFLKNKGQSVVSVSEVQHSPYWSFEVDGKQLKPIFGRKYLNLRRQDLPTTYLPNGAIYISSPKRITKYKSFFIPDPIPYVMPIERSIDIDTEIDFFLVELLIKKGLK